MALLELFHARGEAFLASPLVGVWRASARPSLPRLRSRHGLGGVSSSGLMILVLRGMSWRTATAGGIR
jgi:hypothetical protein